LAPHDLRAGSNPGLAATYTEHGSITSEKPENRSKSGARNHLYRTRLHYTRDRQ